jgi:hypothetical protein
MDYGQLLSRAWNIIWEHKFLILLGVLVALGSSGGGGGNANFSTGNGDFNFQPPDDFEFHPPDILDDFGLPAIGIVVILTLITIALIVGLTFWILSTISRGGLIAGVSVIDAGGASSFGQAFRAGWQKGWTLLGIGIVPAIPGFILFILGLFAAVSYLSFSRVNMGRTPFPPVGAAVGIVVLLACLLVPIALVLGLLRTFANRACMLEDLGVFAAYKRGTAVLFDNIGPALVLFLIQIAINIGIGIAMILPGIIMALCCLLWPVLILIQGVIAAYFSTLWTLAWREWTGSKSGQVIEASAATV